MWSVTMDVSVSAMFLPVKRLTQASSFLAKTSITRGAPKVMEQFARIFSRASGDLRT